MPNPHVDTSKFAMYYGEYRFQPAPLMAYDQAPITDGAGTRIADRVTLSFTGSLLNLSDLASGDASAMISLRDDMINALSGNNREFRLLHWINSTQPSGTAIINEVYPRVEGLSFTEGVWTNKIDYSFSLVYETNLVSGAVPVSDYSDGWSFQESEDKWLIRATHDVSAVGINTSLSGNTSNAIDNAKTWVLARMGVGTIPTGYPAFCDSGTMGNYRAQRYRTERMSLTEGTYEATEDITIASGEYANSMTVQLQTNEEFITTVTINGDIEGLGRFDAAINRAVSGWNNDVQGKLPDIASHVYNELGGSGTLNTSKQQSMSVTRDTYNGRIGYSVSYSDDPNLDLPSGIAEISISKQIQYPVRKMVAFEIPSRILGSIVHDIGTPTDGSISINGTIRGDINTQITYLKTVAEDQVNALRPNASAYTRLWITDKSQTENIQDMTFSFNVGWAFTDSLTNVQSASGDITF